MNETTINERRDALRWLLDNRREDVSFDQAIKTLRAALYGDRDAQTLLDELTIEQAH